MQKVISDCTSYGVMVKWRHENFYMHARKRVVVDKR